MASANPLDIGLMCILFKRRTRAVRCLKSTTRVGLCTASGGSNSSSSSKSATLPATNHHMDTGPNQPGVVHVFAFRDMEGRDMESSLSRWAWWLTRHLLHVVRFPLLTSLVPDRHLTRAGQAQEVKSALRQSRLPLPLLATTTVPISPFQFTNAINMSTSSSDRSGETISRMVCRAKKHSASGLGIGIRRRIVTGARSPRLVGTRQVDTQ